MFSSQLAPSLLPTSVKKGVCLPRLKAKSGPERSHGVPNDIPLPHGVWWLRHTNVKEEAVYGDSFVIHRSSQPSFDLMVISPEDTTVQVWIPDTIGTGIIPIPRTALLPPEFVDEKMTVDVEILSEEGSKGESALVVVGSGPVQESECQPSSPRRTSKVKFTCNRCGSRTEKFINPHAWNHGVVFCRCEGCKVIHLIRDQKGIFTCLKGPIFPQQLDPKTFKIPDGLPQNPSLPNQDSESDDELGFWPL